MAVTRRQFLGSSLTATGLSFAGASLPRAAEQHSPEVRKPAPAANPQDWGWVRSQFRLDPNYAHLSNFYIVSHPQPVRDAIDRYRRGLDENPFLFLEQHMFEKEEDQLWKKVTAAAAAYTGAKPEEIALTSSATMGLALVYNGLRLKPGQEILTTTHDHYSHHESIRLAAAKSGTTVRQTSLYDTGAKATADEMVSRLHDAIRPATRVVGVTWTHSNTGVRTPVRRFAEALAAINRNRDEADRALLVVDGTHAFGAVDETVASLGCDFFASGTHKWILAPRGTGILYAPAARWALVQPTIPTFMDLDVYNAWQDGRVPGPTTAAAVSPGGFFAYEHQWAAVEAFRFHEAIGRPRIAARVAELNTRIKDGLAKIPKVTLHTPMDPAISAGINCFEVAGFTPQQVVSKLLDRRIVASTSPYKVTYPRLSAGIMNTPEEIDRALAAVRALAA
ncbi:MAG TPA: aminotransferase class V-fold PLP-dependent enzyme [Candidatus Polarisedimenticolia bacterium]|jgi:selenocysteine lyase/cysteine desulfurase|nr:aminotransferase class V-fold PLP-dependent enzyme [Candidatus Polarisedimenticolia bacterium]